jgi:hypothetical protein
MVPEDDMHTDKPESTYEELRCWDEL